MAHNFIRDGVALALQPILATAGYILPTAKVEVEKPHLVQNHPGVKPLDLSFDVDPMHSPDAPSTCPFDTVGWDVTIVPPVPPSPVSGPLVDVIESVTAAAEQHLQSRERMKLNRSGDKDPATGRAIPGDEVMGGILDANAVLIPMAIDPHGNWGPMMENSLFGFSPRKNLTFTEIRPNARRMYERATTYPCPIGIVNKACSNWAREPSRQFYGHTYSAPSPKEHIQQQLGLVIVKALALHLRNATRKMGKKQSKCRVYPSRESPGPIINLNSTSVAADSQ